jgi:uncharacterized membrane protein YfcA
MEEEHNTHSDYREGRAQPAGDGSRGRQPLMPESIGSAAGLAALVFLAAVLYSSVGHGGASGYLAAMALFGVPAPLTKPAALVMNVAVAAIGTVRFAHRGLVPWRLLVPLCLGSIPAAALGGYITLPIRTHRILLGVVLLFAAARLWMHDEARTPRREPPSALLRVLIGAALGVVSGLTGVGGGIFLSPLLILTGWEETRRTAGASATFILLNSVAGLAGHLVAGRQVPPEVSFLVPVAVSGGLIGAWLGSTRLPTLVLRRLLASVLVVAGLKLLLTVG